MLNTLAGMVYSARGIDKASRVEVVSPGQQWSKATFVLRVYIILYIYSFGFAGHSTLQDFAGFALSGCDVTGAQHVRSTQRV